MSTLRIVGEQPRALSHVAQSMIAAIHAADAATPIVNGFVAFEQSNSEQTMLSEPRTGVNTEGWLSFCARAFYGLQDAT